MSDSVERFEMELVPDEEGNDGDSALGSSTGSTTQSLSSWIWQYREENGRTYHAFHDGKYWGPNDEQAQEHLDIGHHLFTLTLDGKLYLAPIGPGVQNVLDIGTGTGLWSIDFADQHPSATVVGTDLSPIQPTWVPPNIKFEIDDCEAHWTFPENHFDFIHIRSMFGCVIDWPGLYAQAMRCLKPGGYIEHVEYSPGAWLNSTRFPTRENLYEKSEENIEYGERTGRTFLIFWLVADYLRQGGFVNVQEHRYKWPIGPWPKDKKLKELGMWCRAHVEAGFDNWWLAILSREYGWSREKITEHVEAAKARLCDKTVQKWQEVRFVYGMKPNVLNVSNV